MYFLLKLWKNFGPLHRPMIRNSRLREHACASGEHKPRLDPANNCASQKPKQHICKLLLYNELCLHDLRVLPKSGGVCPEQYVVWYPVCRVGVQWPLTLTIHKCFARSGAGRSFLRGLSEESPGMSSPESNRHDTISTQSALDYARESLFNSPRAAQEELNEECMDSFDLVCGSVRSDFDLDARAR